MNKQAGRVEGAHQLGEREQRADAVLADGECHGAERAERRHPHDDADDAEQDVRHLVDELEHRLAALAPTACSAKPNSTENSSTCRISPLAKASTTVFGMMFSRKSVVDCSFPVRRTPRSTCVSSAGGIDVHSGAGLQRVDDDQADDQRDGADHFEIEQRVAAGLARPSSCSPCRRCRPRRCRR